MILLVDDEEDVRHVIGRTLRTAGYEVEEAADGAAAAVLLAGRTYELVITDVVMPGRDGLDLLGDLARLDKPPPVLVISGGGLKLSPEFVLTASRALGASEVLHKPFAMAELLARVSALLAPR